MSGPGRLFYDDEETAAVVAAMAGTLNRYRYGLPGGETFVSKFEGQARQAFDATFCVATNSCTSALLAGLTALGVGPGDEVIVPGYTFIASIASIVYTGATPVLAEIDDTLNLDPADLRAKITSRTKAVMPVHMLGAAADLESIGLIAAEHGVKIAEDVAQACGGSIKGKSLGTFGDFGAFSLNYFKVITAGDGGFLLTDDSDLYRRAYGVHDHGFRPLRGGAAEDDERLFGLNLRMPDLVGAVASVQLGKIKTVLQHTRRVKDMLLSCIGDLPRGVSRRRLVDPAGDCALALVYIFDDPEAADLVAHQLGTTTLAFSGRHNYANMGQLTRLDAGPDGSAPFRTASSVPAGDYRKGVLPSTDAILSRSVALSTGASDLYAGTGFGVNALSTDQEIEDVAGQYTKAVKNVLG